MYSQEYEFTAVHEAGHAVCVACCPPLVAITSFEMPEPRIKGIKIWCDEEKKRYDGKTFYEPDGLKDGQRLFIAVGGGVAELVARAGGTWDIATIQKEFFGGRFDDTQDMDDINRYLDRLCKDRSKEEVKTTTVSSVCSALERNWKLVLQVASELPEDRKGTIIDYDELSDDTKAQLMQLRDNG